MARKSSNVKSKEKNGKNISYDQEDVDIDENKPASDLLRLPPLAEKKNVDENDIKTMVNQIQEVVRCSEDVASFALHDADNDVEKAITSLVQGGVNQIEDNWEVTGKKGKKKNKASKTPLDALNDEEKEEESSGVIGDRRQKKTSKSNRNRNAEKDSEKFIEHGPKRGKGRPSKPTNLRRKAMPNNNKQNDESDNQWDDFKFDLQAGFEITPTVNRNAVGSLPSSKAPVGSQSFAQVASKRSAPVNSRAVDTMGFDEFETDKLNVDELKETDWHGINNVIKDGKVFTRSVGLDHDLFNFRQQLNSAGDFPSLANDGKTQNISNIEKQPQATNNPMNSQFSWNNQQIPRNSMTFHANSIPNDQTLMSSNRNSQQNAPAVGPMSNVTTKLNNMRVSSNARNVNESKNLSSQAGQQVHQHSQQNVDNNNNNKLSSTRQQQQQNFSKQQQQQNMAGGYRIRSRDMPQQSQQQQQHMKSLPHASNDSETSQQQQQAQQRPNNQQQQQQRSMNSNIRNFYNNNMSNNNNINSQNDIRSNKIGHPTQSQQQLTTQQQPLSDTREKEELLQGFLAKNRNTGRGNKNVNQQYQQQHQQQQQQQRTEYAKPQLNTSKPNPSLANQYSINDKNDINKSQAAQHLSSSASSAFSQTAAYSSKTPNVVTSSNLSQPKAHNLQPSSRNNPSVSSNVVMTPLASHTNNNFANSSTLANSAFQNPVTSVNPNFSNNRVQANQQRFDNRQHHQRIASGGQQSNPAAAAAAQQQQHHAQMMYGAQHGHPANIHVFPHGVYSSPMGLDPQGAPPMMDLVGGMAGRDNNMNFVNDGSFPMGHFQGFPMNLAPHQFGGMPSVSSSGVNKGLGGASMPGNAPGPYGLQFDSSALKGMNAGGFAPFDAYGGSAFYGKGGGKSGFDNSASSNIGGGAGSGAAHGQYGLGVMQAGASTQAAQMQQNQAQQHSFYPTAGNHGGVTMGAPVLAAGTANAAAGAAANVALSTKEYKSGNANYWSGN